MYALTGGGGGGWGSGMGGGGGVVEAVGCNSAYFINDSLLNGINYFLRRSKFFLSA